MLPHFDSSPVKFFSKLYKLIFGYFDPIIFFLIIKINNFRGDLSDISAETATLNHHPCPVHLARSELIEAGAG